MGIIQPTRMLFKSLGSFRSLSYPTKKALLAESLFKINFTSAQWRPVLRLWLGLGEPQNALVALPLTALLEQFHALKALQNIAFYRDGAGTLETAMLRHGSKIG